jgi:hypothetical protein
MAGQHELSKYTIDSREVPENNTQAQHNEMMLGYCHIDMNPLRPGGRT